MKKAVVFLANGFEDIEALATVDILRRGGVDVTTAGVTGDTVTSSHNVQVLSDKSVSNINAADFDAVICPGGMPGATNLRDSDKVVSVIKEAYDAGKIVAAICAAPMVLEKAGVLQGKNFTMYPGMESHAPSGNYKNNVYVVQDGSVITGAGPAATFEFALTLVSNLQGKEIADQVAQGMLIK